MSGNHTSLKVCHIRVQDVLCSRKVVELLPREWTLTRGRYVRNVWRSRICATGDRRLVLVDEFSLDEASDMLRLSWLEEFEDGKFKRQYDCLPFDKTHRFKGTGHDADDVLTARGKMQQTSPTKSCSDSDKVGQ